MSDLKMLQKKAALVRKWSMIATTEAGSGHPTSCLSAADLTTVLFDSYFSYYLKNPLSPYNDRMVFSKGHAAPLLYTLFAIAGAMPLKELTTLRKFGSRLEGHPTPRFPYAEAATGSLGQGLSVAAGLAYGIRAEISNIPKVFCLLGDGELAEGNVWEAANFASYYKLNNLIAIADINRLGQSQATMFGHDIEEYVQRFSAFGWEVIAINGHDLTEIDKAFDLAVHNKSDRPFVIVAKTQKGHGVSFLADKDNWHGKPLKKEDLEKALQELGDVDDSLQFKLKLRPDSAVGKKGLSPHAGRDAQWVSLQKQSITSSLSESRNQNEQKSKEKINSTFSSLPGGYVSLLGGYKIGDEVATREVYGDVLAKLGESNPDIYTLDGDTKNSTYSEKFLKAHPTRFIECFIAEQNMVGVAIGLSRYGKKPCVSTFDAFFSRALDQIRMAAVSKANMVLCGSHIGVSIGEDGPSQMGLENIGFIGAIPDTIIMEPSDAVSLARLLPQLVDHQGISYLRTLRPKTPVLYDTDEEFVIGGSKVLRSSKKDALTVVACGITVHEALKAYELLIKEGIAIRVLDAYSLKPLDGKTLRKAAKETTFNKIITVEDYSLHGGLGDFVLSELADTGILVTKMAVDHISCSGLKDELLEDAGISAKHIVARVKQLTS